MGRVLRHGSRESRDSGRKRLPGLLLGDAELAADLRETGTAELFVDEVHE
jgi:hypothetical protein